MNNIDFYVEYYEELDRRLDCFLSASRKDKEIRLGGQNIKEPLHTFLFYRFTMERDYYNQCRIKGMSIDKAMEQIDSFLNSFEIGKGEQNYDLLDIENHCWCNLLSEFEGALIVYIFNERQLKYLTPLLQKIDCPVLLLAEYDISEDIDLTESVNALTFAFSDKKIFEDKILEHNFPLVFHYTNTFSILLRILNPCGVLCLEGCHFQEQLLAIVADNLNIPSYCVQQGWPSMMRTGFKRLLFRYFFTWGERFSDLWAKCNPLPSFVSTGYMYETDDRLTEEKKCVSFFLQSPCYLSDYDYFIDILDLIIVSARAFPYVTFLVREHPEYKLDSSVIAVLKTLDNVEIVSGCRLQDVYGRTQIVVSHFSSSLMEGILYGCIPLVYDPTSNSHYCPDVEKEGFGRIVKSPDMFHRCLNELLNGCLQPMTSAKRHDWFIATGNVTLDNMIRFLKSTWKENKQ